MPASIGVEEMVQEVLAVAGRPGVPTPHVRTEVMRGAAADLLVEVAGEADLLVVGSRGRGALRGLLLGSVALHRTARRVPVLVVHPQSSGPASGPVRSGRHWPAEGEACTGLRAGTEIVVGGARVLAASVLAPLLRRRYNRWGARPRGGRGRAAR